MKNGLSMAIIGGGIAGLSLAASLAKHSSSLHITLFEKQLRLGGRVHTKQVAANSYADLGANLIDFENKNQESMVRAFLTSVNNAANSRLQLFKQPFLIYQHDQLRQPDYQKQRFYYEGGFKQLISDLQGHLSKLQDKCLILNDCPITKIIKKQSKWAIIHANNTAIEQVDFVVLGCNGSGIVQILQASNSQSLMPLLQQIKSIKYTMQISIVFEISHANFSSILFKNHPITFISSHIQKYRHQKPLIVMQTSEDFSQKHFDDSQENIEKAIRQLMPSFLKSMIGKCLSIKKWFPSLIREKRASRVREKLNVGQKVFVIGDVLAGGSRVSNAIESSLVLSEYLCQLMHVESKL